MLDRKIFLVVVPFFLLVGCGQSEGSSSVVTEENREEVPVALKSENQDWLNALNQARTERRDCHDGLGLVGPSKALSWNDELYASAHEHSYDMAMSDTFSHYGSGTKFDTTAINNNSKPSYFYERIESNGYGEYKTLGENIAGGQESIEEVMKAWLASPGHCANIMKSDFNEVGIAVVTERSTQFGIYWTQNFGSK